MKTNKSILLAFVLFVAMTTMGVVSTQAQVNLLDPIQSPDTNLLLSTTGPNTVGKGHLQLSGKATWFGYSQDREVYPAIDKNANSSATIAHDHHQELGGGIGLRYGLGNRFELFARVAGVYERSHFEFSNDIYSDTSQIYTPSLGLKMMLNEGGCGWVPQMSVFALIDLSVAKHGNRWDVLENGAAPVLGLQCRNRLSNRWTLDYGVSYRFNKDNRIGTGRNVVYALQRDKPFQFDIMARWLATDRLMVSAGMENVGGVVEVMWQATPNLQLKAQGGIAAGVGFRTGMLETNALLGVNWMLR